jgi:integrase
MAKQNLKLERTKTPGIYKRGNRYMVVFRDARGQQRKRSARTLAEARELKATSIADVKRGEHRETSKATFAEYAARWINTFTGRTTRGILPETLAGYRRQLGLDEDGEPTGAGAVAFFGRMRLAEIEPQHVKDYAAKVAASGVSANTVRLYLAPLKALLATAREDGVIRSNPCAGVRIAVREEVDDDGAAKVKAPTVEEYGRLIAALPEHWRLLGEFLGETGLRIGEAIALTWADLDLGASRVQVRRRFYRGRFGPPKSKYGRRLVPISEAMGQRLWAERSKRRAHDDAFVFVSARGQMVDHSNFCSRIFKPAAKAAGIEWATIHSLRHYCATRLFTLGFNAKQAQVWLGHHSPAFTLSVYVHLLSDDLPPSPFGDAVGNKWATQATETDRNESPAEEVDVVLSAAKAS